MASGVERTGRALCYSPAALMARGGMRPVRALRLSVRSTGKPKGSMPFGFQRQNSAWEMEEVIHRRGRINYRKKDYFFTYREG
jgi:hypothetical protein